MRFRSLHPWIMSAYVLAWASAYFINKMWFQDEHFLDYWAADIKLACILAALMLWPIGLTLLFMDKSLANKHVRGYTALYLLLGIPNVAVVVGLVRFLFP